MSLPCNTQEPARQSGQNIASAAISGGENEVVTALPHDSVCTSVSKSVSDSFQRGITIGPYRLPGILLLAPMAGITDSTFRQLCLQQGAALAASEMISSDTTVYASSKTRSRVERARGDAIHAVQIAGSEPEMMAKAARLNVEMGAGIIDINMGCPAKKVCKKLAGSALLSDELLVRQILETVVDSVDVPVTLKIRTGPTPDTRNGVAIAQIAEAAGIRCLAVHGRTRADKFNGHAEYETIRDIKQAVSIPIIANGDIVDGPSAHRVLHETGCDGIMVGRAAQGNPFIFREMAAYLSLERQGSDFKLDKPTDAEIRSVLHTHLTGIYATYGEYRGVRVARKHISWYLKNKRDSGHFRNMANIAESAAEQLKIVDDFFAR